MEVDEPMPGTSSGSGQGVGAGAGAVTADGASASTSASAESTKNQDRNFYMASAGVVGSVTVSLHPLVIMNISEHWTRFKVQFGIPEKVFGAIIGKQKGRHIEIMNSFELVYTLHDEKVVIDRDYYNMKEEQFKQVFSEMDFLGWYSTGDHPGKVDADVHKQILDINESPLFLQLNPLAKNSDIPLTMYESLIDIVQGEARMLFVKLDYNLATEEAERIGLDHVARISSADDVAQSKVSEHFLAQHSAILMLASRVSRILDYVKAVESGELARNHEILRGVKALADNLPILESGDKFKPEYYTQCNDVALMTMMGAIHKSCNDLVQFINKFNLLNQRQGASGRRMRGIFF